MKKANHIFEQIRTYHEVITLMRENGNDYLAEIFEEMLKEAYAEYLLIGGEDALNESLDKRDIRKVSKGN